MPSDRYSFRTSTVNAGIASSNRRDERVLQRERVRARRQRVSAPVTASLVVLPDQTGATATLVAIATADDQGNQRLESAQANTSVVLPDQSAAPVALEATIISTATEGQGTQTQVRAPVTPLTVAELRPLQSEATVALATTATAVGFGSPQRVSASETARHAVLGVSSPDHVATEVETAASAASFAQTAAEVGLRNQRQESTEVAASGVQFGNQQEVSEPATTLFTASQIPLPTPVASAAGNGSGIGMKRSTSSSAMSSDKRRKLEGPVSSGESSSQQVAESSAAALARDRSAVESPVVEAAGTEDIEMAEAIEDVLSGPPPFPLPELLGAEPAPLEIAPASSRAVDAAEAMLDLAWVQPVPTPLPSPVPLSLPMTSPSPPPPLPPPPPQPQPQPQPTLGTSDEMEAVQAMLGLSQMPEVAPHSPASPAAAPPSPRALEAAEGFLGLFVAPLPPQSPPAQAPPSPPAPPAMH
ncbi:hypothetical protein K501DRAFT_273683 [Backusella circina FSU 941]|nr:hypothetical protein K501DRAFT_273683 [Backusella circina FSU 941]